MSADTLLANPADFEIDITINDAGWRDVLSSDKIDINTLAGAAIRAAATAPQPPVFQELSIALVSDDEIQALNREYRGKDKPTNVLSFSAQMDGMPSPILGDIVLARETIRAEAKKLGIYLSFHLTHLIIHGFYHLCDYDHEDDKEAAHMQALEIAALKRLDIANPYDTELTL